jgi:hypothetical protein
MKMPTITGIGMARAQGKSLSGDSFQVPRSIKE